MIVHAAHGSGAYGALRNQIIAPGPFRTRRSPRGFLNRS
jgi:hypothetical protein